MLLQEYKENFPTWEKRKEKLRQKDIIKLCREHKIHSIISRTATELDSVLEFEGLEFCVVDKRKVRLSSDEFFTVRNKQRVSRDFIGHDMSYIRNYCKSTYKDFSNLGLKGGFVYNRKENKTYYLFFLDIDNDGKLKNKALELRKQIGIDTFIVETPRGGYHLYFILESYNDSGKNIKYWQKYISDSKLFDIPNVDIKMKGYVLAPGSKTDAGVYQVINESPPAVLKLETWREMIFNKIKPWLIENNIPFSESDSSLSSTDKESKKSNSSIGVNIPSPSCKNTDKSYFHSKKKIIKSERSITLTKIAGGLVWGVKSEQELLEKLLEIRNTRFEDPESFSDYEVEKICSWLWNKHSTFHFVKDSSLSSTDKESNSSIAMKPASSLTFLEGKLVEIFEQFQKTEKHEQSLTEISASVQKWFEQKFNTKYSKPINQNVVARLLKQAGFSSKIVQKNNKRKNLWNFSTSLIEKMEEIIESQNWKYTSLSSTDKESNSSIAMKPTSQPIEFQEESQNSQEPTSVVELELDNTTHSNDQFKNPSQNIILKTQESNQDTQMTIHTQEQKECPAESPSESEIDSEQARLQEIELELTTITNSKELSLKEKKELYSAVALKINSKDLSKISKNLLNFIPSEDYRKICKR